METNTKQGAKTMTDQVTINGTPYDVLSRVAIAQLSHPNLYANIAPGSQLASIRKPRGTKVFGVWMFADGTTSGVWTIA